MGKGEEGKTVGRRGRRGRLGREEDVGDVGDVEDLEDGRDKETRRGKVSPQTRSKAIGTTFAIASPFMLGAAGSERS